jgi:hypothetical protein
MEIQFRPGHPQAFIATRTFDIGKTDLKAIKGGQIEFDGTLMTLDGHPTMPQPQLRGAIRVGWLVLATEYDSGAVQRPVSAGVQVRKADGGNPMDPASRAPIGTTVDSEEREVSNVASHTAATLERNESNYRREGRENRAVRPGEAGFEVVEPQDGVHVRSLKTPAKQRTDATRASTAISEANKVKIDAQEGYTREEMTSKMTPEERAQYELEIASHKMAHVPEEASQIVARVEKVQNQEKEGFTVTNEVGGGVKTADLGGTGIAGKDQVSTVESEGIKFTNTNGPKRGENVTSDNGINRQVAKSICPDFPDNYKFADPVRKKIARLQADFDDRYDVIRAVAAAETDPEMKSRVVQEFPEAFAS